MKFFKVVNSIRRTTEINTDSINYSLTLPKLDIYKEFIDYVIRSSIKHNLGFDLFFCLKDNLVEKEPSYFARLLNSSFNISVEFLTQNANNKGKYITKSLLLTLLNEISRYTAHIRIEGIYLWEAIYEKVRKEEFENYPARLKSFFLFDNVEDCRYYINNHKGGGEICEVNPVETKAVFKADMNILDIIPNHWTYLETVNLVTEYWQGKASNKPVFEYIFKGRCELKPLNKNNGYAGS